MTRPWTVSVGERFGALVVTEAMTAGEAGTPRNKGGQARVRCDCGARFMVPAHKLRRGSVLNCGGSAHRPLEVA